MSYSLGFNIPRRLAYHAEVLHDWRMPPAGGVSTKYANCGTDTTYGSNTVLLGGFVKLESLDASTNFECRSAV